MATKATLRRLVLAHLRVIDATTTTAPAELSSLVDIFIDAARATLLEKGLCWWDEDDIPDAVLIPLRAYVAAISCSDFGKAGKGYEGKERPALKEIAALKSTAEREVVRVDYF